MYFQVLLLNRSCNFEYFKTFILCRGFHFSKKKATIHTTSLENTWIVLWLLISLLIYSHISELLKAGYCSSQHPFRTLAQLKILLQSHPCWRIFSIVEPTIWHLGDSPKYEWPIHRAQWSCLAKALPPLPPPYAKQYSAQQSWHFSPKSTKEELEAVPETLKALSLCEMQVLGTSKAIYRQWANHTVLCEI